MIRANFITELKRENAMRRKHWARVRGSEAEFIDPDHQSQYKQTAEMLEFFEAMTDTEFYKVNERVRREKEAKVAQSTMF